MQESNLKPELRFPEFIGFWNEKKMEEVFLNSRDKGNSSLPIFSVSQAHGLIPRDSLERIIQKDAKAESNLAVNPGDLVYNMMRMWQGAIGLAKSASMVSPAYVVLRPNQDENSSFYNYLFSKKRSLYLFWAYSYGLTNDRLRLYFKDFSGIKRHAPSYKEQQKIATFLKAIDQRIQLLEKKKAKLQEYKKGVMQKLFSQKIRFKDENGHDFPDWEEKNLGEIGEFKTSSVDKKIDENLPIVYLVNYMNVYRHETISNANSDYLMQVSATENQLVSNNLKKGDILFTPSSETPSDIGHSVVIFEDLENTLYSYHLIRFRPTVDIDLMYSHYFCNTPSALKQISSFATGSTRFTISVDSFSKIQVSLPSLPEQTKIAAFLTSLDKSIESVEEEIEGTLTFKKGLLQKMFV